MDLSGYMLEALCREGAFELFRGYNRNASASDPPTILVLVPTFERPRFDYVGMLEREFALRTELDPDWAALPREVARLQGSKVLLLDDPGGRPLQQLLEAPVVSSELKLDVAAFLKVAIGISRSVGEMHGRGIVHKDLKPAHILLDPETAKIWLTGFGIASQTRRERQIPAPPETIAGTLAYMAPEQTGCMNRSIDSRSDLYALGVVLYEMLTRALPFVATEPMEWVHSHVARRPTPPRERNSEVPDPISNIVMKLLAKSAEDRYQTASGLEHDLRVCLRQLDAVRTIEDFELGAFDRPNRMFVPERLFGRDRETAAITAAFNRVATSGTPEVILVSGYSGIGKSAVVSELQKGLILRQGLFATGKFDQLKRDVPYLTLCHAFQRMVFALLIESDVELDRWRDAFRNALGSDGGLIVDLIPPLKIVIGEQPPVPELPPNDAKRRFHSVFSRFLMVFAQEQHPLTIFLDDLQWADLATLDLIESLLLEPEVRHLLLLGAYRDNEVDPLHPVVRSFDRIRSGIVTVRDIVLQPLSRRDTGLLVANSLNCEVTYATELSNLIHSKTAGNPFFLIQLLTTLTDDGLLFLDDQRRWRWDLAGIDEKGYTENVIDLMAAKLSRLPLGTQRVFQLLACLGSTSSSRLLQLVGSTPGTELQLDLKEVLKTELVLFLEGSYRFLHDRVQEAAYRLLSGENRVNEHLRIGRLMMTLMSAEERKEAVFEIVNQFNQAIDLVVLRDEKLQLAELNLIAGDRAKASTAISSALAYYASGSALIAAEEWPRVPDLAFALELKRAECEFLTGDLVAAEERLSHLVSRAHTILDHRALACLRIDLYTTLGHIDVAIEIGLTFLGQYDQDWPVQPTDDDVKNEYDRTWELIGTRTADELIELPLMSDPASLAVVDVLTQVATPALLTNENLYSVLICRTINLSLQHGNTDASAHAYVHLGAMAGRRFGNYRTGFDLGSVGFELLERGLQRFRARTLLSFGGLVMTWTHPFAAGRDLMRQAFDDACRLGDLTFAGYCCNNLVSNLLAAGESLAEIQRETEVFMEFARKARFGLVTDFLRSQYAFVCTMRGITEPLGRLHVDHLDEQALEEHLANDPRLAIAMRWYWIKKLQARYFAADYRSALEASANALRSIAPQMSFIEAAEAHFFSALTLAALCNNTASVEGQDHFRSLTEHSHQLAVWAGSCPENFQGRAIIVRAEIARIEGRQLDAQRLYEEAVQSARTSGFPHNEAIANELAARFYASCGLETSSHAYLRNAHQAYLHWGADGKARQLDLLYPDVKLGLRPHVSSGTVEALVEQLDLTTVLKVSQAIQGEMRFDSILDVVMRTAIEHAGAERALLFFSGDTGLRTVAEATTVPHAIDVQLLDEPMDAHSVSEHVLSYVLHSREVVILDDAAAPNPYSSDAYLATNRVRSVLCLPLINQGRSIGVLYLENNQLSQVFAPARVAAIKVIASQAAISIDNARLYRDLAKREARIGRLVDANIIGIFIWELGGRIVEANDALLTMTGYDRAEFAERGLNWTELVPGDLRALDDALFSELRGTGRLRPFESEYMRKDGTRVHVLVGVAAFDDDAEQGVAYVLDLTERNEAQEALNLARAELAHFSRVSAVGALTASITHEISQPLSGIITNASLALLVLDSAQPDLNVVRETVVRTMRDGDRARGVLDRLRSLFSKGEFADERLDLNEAAREVITLVSADLRRQGIDLRLELADDLPAVFGDRLQLQQVVQNIVRNASDAMTDIGDRPRRMLIRTAARPDNTVTFSVTDSGIGLPSTGQESLFDAFYTTKTDGMGIGLFVSRTIIERHNGSLWAEPNQSSPGATFAFALPSVG